MREPVEPAAREKNKQQLVHARCLSFSTAPFLTASIFERSQVAPGDNVLNRTPACHAERRLQCPCAVHARARMTAWLDQRTTWRIEANGACLRGINNITVLCPVGPFLSHILAHAIDMVFRMAPTHDSSMSLPGIPLVRLGLETHTCAVETVHLEIESAKKRLQVSSGLCVRVHFHVVNKPYWQKEAAAPHLQLRAIIEWGIYGIQR